jgi:hypothetical protein
MNAQRDIERRLTDFYSREGVFRAPDRVLTSALVTIESTKQRRRFDQLPRFFQSQVAVASFAVVAVLAIVVGAIGLAIYAGSPSGIGGPPFPSPSPTATTTAVVTATTTATATPTATARPNEEGSGNFAAPFTYVLPTGAEFDYGTRNSTFFEIRIPAAAEAGHAAGVIVQAIGGGRVDPCDEESAPLAISSGPQPVIDYLRAVPDLTVTAESAATVGDLPAVQARVTAGIDSPTCQDIWPWVEATEAFSDIPRDLVVRIVAVDLGEARARHVVFTIFGEDENPGWAEMAEELIDSFRF